MNICLASNEAYFSGLYCTVGSMLRSAAEKQRMTLYILDGGISGSSWEKLERLCGAAGAQLRRVLLEESMPDGLLSGPNSSLMTYARLLMPSLLDCSKVLYLDADLLVLSDIGVLWAELDGSDAPVLAVPDVETPEIGKDCPALCRQMEVPGQQVYFNAGVLGVNLDLWREWNIQDKSISLLKGHVGLYRFHDQSALNLLLGAEVRLFGAKWNVPYWKFDKSFSESTVTVLAGIIHYTRYKPWLSYFGTPSYFLFMMYADSVGCLDNKAWGGLRSRFQWEFISSTALLRSGVYYLRSFARSSAGMKRSDWQIARVWKERFFKWCGGVNRLRVKHVYEQWETATL